MKITATTRAIQNKIGTALASIEIRKGCNIMEYIYSFFIEPLINSGVYWNNIVYDALKYFDLFGRQVTLLLFSQCSNLNQVNNVALYEQECYGQASNLYIYWLLCGNIQIFKFYGIGGTSRKKSIRITFGINVIFSCLNL